MNRKTNPLIAVLVVAALAGIALWSFFGQRLGYGFGRFGGHPYPYGPYGRGFMWNGGGGYGPFGHGYMWGGGMGVEMIFFWVILLVVVVVLIAGLPGKTGVRQGGRDPSPDALEILKQRYARGEIDKAEYEAKRRDLLE